MGEDDQWFDSQDSTSDGVFHVPLIFSFPQILPSNKEADALVEVGDITPTIFELLVQEQFGTSSGKGMANALYGASGRSYARSEVLLQERKVPMISLGGGNRVWQDAVGKINHSGNVLNVEQHRAKLSFREEKNTTPPK